MEIIRRWLIEDIEKRFSVRDHRAAAGGVHHSEKTNNRRSSATYASDGLGPPVRFYEEGYDSVRRKVNRYPGLKFVFETLYRRDPITVSQWHLLASREVEHQIRNGHCPDEFAHFNKHEHLSHDQLRLCGPQNMLPRRTVARSPPCEVSPPVPQFLIGLSPSTPSPPSPSSLSSVNSSLDYSSTPNYRREDPSNEHSATAICAFGLAVHRSDAIPLSRSVSAESAGNSNDGHHGPYHLSNSIRGAHNQSLTTAGLEFTTNKSTTIYPTPHDTRSLPPTPHDLRHLHRVAHQAQPHQLHTGHATPPPYPFLNGAPLPVFKRTRPLETTHSMHLTHRRSSAPYASPCRSHLAQTPIQPRRSEECLTSHTDGGRLTPPFPVYPGNICGKRRYQNGDSPVLHYFDGDATFLDLIGRCDTSEAIWSLHLKTQYKRSVERMEIWRDFYDQYASWFPFALVEHLDVRSMLLFYSHPDMGWGGLGFNQDAEGGHVVRAAVRKTPLTTVASLNGGLQSASSHGNILAVSPLETDHTDDSEERQTSTGCSSGQEGSGTPRDGIEMSEIPFQLLIGRENSKQVPSFLRTLVRPLPKININEAVDSSSNVRDGEASSSSADLLGKGESGVKRELRLTVLKLFVKVFEVVLGASRNRVPRSTARHLGLVMSECGLQVVRNSKLSVVGALRRVDVLHYGLPESVSEDSPIGGLPFAAMASEGLHSVSVSSDEAASLKSMAKNKANEANSTSVGALDSAEHDPHGSNAQSENVASGPGKEYAPNRIDTGWLGNPRIGAYYKAWNAAVGSLRNEKLADISKSWAYITMHFLSSAILQPKGEIKQHLHLPVLVELDAHIPNIEVKVHARVLDETRLRVAMLWLAYKEAISTNERCFGIKTRSQNDRSSDCGNPEVKSKRRASHGERILEQSDQPSPTMSSQKRVQSTREPQSNAEGHTEAQLWCMCDAALRNSHFRVKIRLPAVEIHMLDPISSNLGAAEELLSATWSAEILQFATGLKNGGTHCVLRAFNLRVVTKQSLEALMRVYPRLEALYKQRKREILSTLSF
eukprot:GHVN01002329.1.p1 GENE.GHVN01002329.1~~GHVN01002329.1.p1  ORF type:complete len:1050 (+),score=156.10 GHVN01002329.1:1691-4840(+)